MSKKGKDDLDGKGLSRRNLLKAGTAAGVSLALGGPASAERGNSDRDEHHGGESHRGKSKDRELTLVNGRIHTMDDHNTVVSSATIRNGLFVAVGRGSNSGPKDEIIDLRGHTVVPGLIESHTHFVSLANRPGYHVAQWERAAHRGHCLDVV